MSDNRPNILFLFPDQHRPDWLGSNPELPLRTPNLDRLAVSGTRFTNAYTPSPICAPARACLASGRAFEQCGVPSNHVNYPLDQRTYYQELQASGYRVCGVGKFDLHKDYGAAREELDWHLDGSRSLAEWGFTEGIDNEGKLDGSRSYLAAGKPKGPYLNYLHSLGLADEYAEEHTRAKENRDAYVTILPEDAYCDNWISENGLRFLRQFPSDQPWHLVVNFTGPHNPMDVTQRMHDAWQNVEFPPPFDNQQADYSAADHQRNRQHYAAMIENIDRQVGRFLEVVSARGELDNTLVVYASDHGEMLGDHGRWGKSMWYDQSAGVPLIVSGPGIRAGVTSDALVSLHDLTATFLDYAGANGLPAMEALTLRQLLEGNTEHHREIILSGLYGWRMLFDGRYKFVTESDLPDRLFDLVDDPNEQINLASEQPDLAARLRSRLQAELANPQQRSLQSEL